MNNAPQSLLFAITYRGAGWVIQAIWRTIRRFRAAIKQQARDIALDLNELDEQHGRPSQTPLRNNR